MPITYILLSPTFGMHQYTADLANRAAATGNWKLETGSASNPAASNQLPTSSRQQPAVRLITTTTLPRDRYSPAVQIITPVTTHGTGFSRKGLDFTAYRRVQSSVFHLSSSIFHFTGVHAWNLPLVYSLRRRGVPVIHTLHDLDPHTGVRFPALIRLWNRLIIASGCHILVHGRRTRDQLIASGVPAERVTYTPLLHGFLSAAHPWPPEEPSAISYQPSAISHQPSAISHQPSIVIFFGRVEAYKGVDTLLAAWDLLKGDRPCGAFSDSGGGFSTAAPPPRLIIAGPVAPGVTLPPLPPGVELRGRRIMDDEADTLFRSASLLVLPYRDATQSALVAAAYAYGLPVIVTGVGALPEYVVEGETGWVAPPADPAALAAALRRALDAAADGGLARMGAAGCAWFDTQRRAEAATLVEMYQRLRQHDSLS